MTLSWFCVRRRPGRRPGDATLRPCSRGKGVVDGRRRGRGHAARGWVHLGNGRQPYSWRSASGADVADRFPAERGPAVSLPGHAPNPGPLKLQLLVADDGRVLLTNRAAASLGTIGAYPSVAVLPPIYSDTPGVEQYLAVLPAHPVKAGDTWQNDFTNQFGSFA